MHQSKPHFVTDAVITPDLTHLDLVVLTQPPRYLNHAGWDVQVESGSELGEIHPLGERLQVIHGLAGLDFDDDLQSAAAFLRKQHEIRVDGGGAAPDWDVLLAPRIHAGVVAASGLDMQQTNNTVVLELFADRPYQNRTHQEPPPHQ